MPETERPEWIKAAANGVAIASLDWNGVTTAADFIDRVDYCAALIERHMQAAVSTESVRAAQARAARFV